MLQSGDLVSLAFQQMALLHQRRSRQLRPAQRKATTRTAAQVRSCKALKSLYLMMSWPICTLWPCFYLFVFEGVHSTVEEQPASSSAAHAGPQTAEQWVEYLVGQLATAGDMQSAKVKAASVLQQFEAFVQAFSKQQVGTSACQVASPRTVHLLPQPTLSPCL